MPLPLSIQNNISTTPWLATLIFIIILIAGLLHEWNEGSLEWT